MKFVQLVEVSICTVFLKNNLAVQNIISSFNTVDLQCQKSHLCEFILRKFFDVQNLYLNIV
jgi:hypothetical protein